MTLPRNKKLPVKRGKDEGRPIVPNKGTGGKGDKDKGKGKKKGSAFYGGVGGYKGVNKKAVKRLVNGVLRDEIRDIRKQGRAVRRDSRELTRGARTEYRRGKSDLEYVHGETGDYLGALGQQNQQMFQQQGNQQAAAQAALQQHLQGTYSGAQQGASDELARLGIQGGGNFSQLMSDQANAQAVGAQMGANTQSALGMAGANSQAGLQMIQGMNQGSFMQGMGKNLNARNDALAEINTNRMGHLDEVRKAISEAKGSRRDMFFQLLQQLQQTGWSQYVDQRQLGQQQQQINMQRRALKKNK